MSRQAETQTGSLQFARPAPGVQQQQSWRFLTLLSSIPDWYFSSKCHDARALVAALSPLATERRRGPLVPSEGEIRMVARATKRRWAGRCIDGLLFGMVGASVAGLIYLFVKAHR